MSKAIPTTGLFEHSSGTLTADGTEQTFFEEQNVGSFEGYLDLSNMADGDQVSIAEYFSFSDNPNYKKYHNDDYSGPQANPVVYIIPKPGGPLKITLQQTQGSYKTFDYKFYQRR